MTPEQVYLKWHEKMRKANEEARLARRKYHKTRSHDDRLDMYLARSEASTINEFLKDFVKLNPQVQRLWW